MGARSTKRDGDGEADGPLRQCALSRAQKPAEDLIRFVVGPDATIVPDLARRLPGRGVWIDANKTAVTEAARRKVFARSLQRPVSVSADLPILVEQLMRRRLTEAVSLANKAGLVVCGFAKVAELIEAERAVVLIHAAEAADDGMGKLDRKFKALPGREDISDAVVRELSIGELSLAMGRPNVIHAAAAAGGASQRLIEEARRLRRYRLVDAPDGSRSPATQPTQGVHD